MDLSLLLSFVLFKGTCELDRKSRKGRDLVTAVIPPVPLAPCTQLTLRKCVLINRKAKKTRGREREKGKGEGASLLANTEDRSDRRWLSEVGQSALFTGPGAAPGQEPTPKEKADS